MIRLAFPAISIFLLAISIAMPAFADQVRTENLSIDGGCLLLNRDLRRNQSFRIEGQNGAHFVARVRWCMYYFRQDTRRVGFQLDPDSKKSWVLTNRDV